MVKKFSLEDKSNDKEFFTIIPNYILNHSTALDQALYLQLKRLSGDRKNYCYPSFNYLTRQLGVGKKRLRKSFEYLGSKGWIENLGKKQVMTAGGMQWVNVYQVNDIWELNINYYKDKGGSKRAPLAKEGLKTHKEGPETSKEGLIVSPKEEPNKDCKKNIFSPKEKIEAYKKSRRWGEIPYYRDEKVVWVKKRNEKEVNRLEVIPREGGNWLEFAGREDEIEWKEK